MRILMIGGTGFIGRHVAARLADAGHEVALLHRGRTRVADAPPVTQLFVDRHNAAGLETCIASVVPDVIVDTIPFTADDVETLLRAWPRGARRLLVISSGDVYARYDEFRRVVPASGDRAPLDEDAALREHLFPYRTQATGPDDFRFSYDKIPVERAAATAGVPATILRLPMVYGPGDPLNRVGVWAVRFASELGRIRLNPAEAGWRCTRGYVEDVAATIALCITDARAIGRTLNLGEPEALSEVEWARAIGRAMGSTIEVVEDAAVPPSGPYEWTADLALDNARVRALGFIEPLGRDAGLARSVPRPLG